MVIKKFVLFAAIAIGCSVLVGCPGSSCIEAQYNFRVKALFSPERDSIYIGDTLMLTVSFPTKLLDTRSGQQVEYNNAKNIGSTLIISELVSGNPIPRDAVADFTYSATQGRIYNDTSVPTSGRVQQLTYQEYNGKYELTAIIIPQKAGIYFLAIGDGLSLGRAGNKNCEKATIETSLNNSNQHLYYYESFSGSPIRTYDKQHMYCVKVLAR